MENMCIGMEPTCWSVIVGKNPGAVPVGVAVLSVKKLTSTATFLYFDFFTTLFTRKVGIYSVFPVSFNLLNKWSFY